MTFATSNDIPRDSFGRPLVVPPEGGKPKAYTRCTTYVDALDDKYNLQQWENRMVAVGLAVRPDLLLGVVAAADNKQQLNILTKQAKEAAKSSAGSTIGTALHALTERLDRGERVDNVPAEYRPDLVAYQAATAKLRVVAIERFTVLDELRIGGTPDRVVEYAGRYYIADVKTGEIDYSALKIAMQLAVYSRSTPYNHATGKREPWGFDISPSRALVIHLPERSGHCELKWVDIGRGWDAVQVATEVRRLRSLRNWYDNFDPLAAVTTVDELYRLWPFYNDRIPVEEFARRKAELLEASA
jgi:predicted RecB family endonuclease